MTAPDYAPFGVDVTDELRVNVRDSRTLTWSPAYLLRSAVAKAVRRRLADLRGRVAELEVVALMLEQTGENVIEKDGGN